MSHSHISQEAIDEKKKVALISVGAAVFLTGSKAIIGLMTGSLGILAEAVHSGLDLVAAIITYFSVRVSDKPADRTHHYGYGKIENLSALFETVLLLVTCGWIIYESLHRLITGDIKIEVTTWSYIVVITSIIIDFNRSKVLMKAAKKHNSHALEADALHFYTDIFSSGVVLIGLIAAEFNIFGADSVAALVVGLLVLKVSYKMGKDAIDILLDKAPLHNIEAIESILKELNDIKAYHDLRVRNSGADTFVDINIHVQSSLSIEKVHEISENIEKRISTKIPRCRVTVHPEPDSVPHS